MALEHNFLMHAVLACSAMHLAHKLPSQKQSYLVRAHSHQDMAMPLFRNVIAQVTPANCHAILVFCYFLVIYSFAADRPDERLLLTDPSSQNPNLLSSWLYFVRNSCFIVCEFWDDILMGPVAPLANSWDEPLPSLEGDLAKKNITDHLFSLIDVREDARYADMLTEAVCQIYLDTANQLGQAIATAQVLNCHGFTTWDAVRMWPMEISSAYVDLLNQKHPVAMVLLGHYCLLLEKIQPHWYFEGRGKKLLAAVLETLDDDWSSRLRSSLKEVASLCT